MIVKGQLEDAQLEIVADNTARDLLDPRVARVCYVVSSNKMYIGNGSSWSNIGDASAVGDIKASMLDETTYQAQFGAEWIIADGRNVTGSDYETITGQTAVPDLRGVFLRGKDNSRGLDPDGDKVLGTYTADKLGTHTHSYSDTRLAVNTAGSSTRNLNGSGPLQVNEQPDQSKTTVPSGSNETAPKSVTVNYFIKINRDLGV